MTLKNRKTRILFNTGILLVLLVSLLLQPISALALGEDTSELSDFLDFSISVQDGKAEVLRGVYVPDILALPIVQQPYGYTGFVSNEDEQTTQFRMANQYGNVGLLAHNHLSGKSFFELEAGDEIFLVYGDGRVEYFVVSEILHYQALQPNSPYSSFSNLDKDEVLSAESMFKRVYFGDRHVTFQTCIEQDGVLSWGRLFVIAIPKAEYDELHPLDTR